jgi:hypothetical protein
MVGTLGFSYLVTNTTVTPKPRILRGAGVLSSGEGVWRLEREADHSYPSRLKMLGASFLSPSPYI